MNGTRTNQFEAPTSLITSISRRRAKVARRIVFTIRNSDDASNTTAIVMNASRIQRVAVSRLLICCCAVMTVSTSGWLLYFRFRTSVSSALKGATRNDSGRS
jgi:hypothetical protein